MNYLKQMEKFLKSYLKRKVKLTTDLMVSFLITGSLSFSATTITSSTSVPITAGGEYILSENEVTLTSENEAVINNQGVNITLNDNQQLNLIKTSGVNSGGVVENGNILGGILVLKGNTGLGTGLQNISVNKLIIEASDYGINSYGKTNINSKDIEIFSNEKGIFIPSVTDSGNHLEINNFENFNIKTINSFAIQNNSSSETIRLVLKGSNNSKLKVSSNKSTIFSYQSGSIVDIYSNEIVLNSLSHVIQAQDGIVKLNGENIIISSAKELDNDGNLILENKNGYALLTFNNGIIHINSDNYNKTLQITGNLYNYGKVNENYNGSDEIIANFGTAVSFLKGSTINGATGKINLSFYNGATWENSGNSSLTNLTLQGGKIISDSNIELLDSPLRMLGSSDRYNSILTGSGSYTSNNNNLIEISNIGNEFNLSDGATLTGNILINTGATLENNGIFSVIGDINNSGKLTLNNGTTINLNNSGTFSNNEGAELIVTSGATAFTNGTATNKGIITLENTKNNLSKLVDNASLDSSGVIKLNDVTNKMSEAEWNSLLEKLSLNSGNVSITGAIVKNDGTSIFLAGNELTGENTVGDIIDQTKDEESIKVEQDTVIIGSKEEDKTHIITDKEINVGGNLTLKSDDTSTGVALDKVTINVTNDKNIIAIGENHKFNETNINLVGNSNLVVGDGNTLTSLEISSGAITTDNTPSFIQTTDKSTLVLKDINVGIDIIGSEKGTGDVITNNTILEGNLEANNLLVIGNTVANGEVNFNKLVIGKLNSGETDIKELFLSSSAKLATSKTKMVTFSDTNITPNTVTIAKDGQLTLEVADDGSNALSNSSGITIVKENSNTSLSKEEKADIVFVLADGTVSKKIAIQINESNTLEAGLIFALNSEVYILEGNLKDGFYAVYNEQLTEAYQDKLNELNKLASNVGGYLSLDKDTRIVQLDKLYTNSIYSETVKAAYDNIKLNEESILELNIPTKIGEWSAGGKALYNKTKYSKKGVLKDNYNTKTDTAGLLGAMEYGIDDTTSIGIAFSGANQSVKNNSGSADGTILYLGTYGKKEFGKYSIIGGIGYQFANYDTNNSAGSFSTSDNYNSNTISLYTEGKYSFELGDNLSIQPKTKLGYTYINQEDTMDNYFGIKDTDISTFDIEIGTDIVKTLNIPNGKVDLSLGTSYVRTLGDTDKEFNGRFIDSDGTAKVLGAQLSKNTGKFTFDVNISKDSGINYTTGIYLKVGSDSSRNYGASLGVGYTF